MAEWQSERTAESTDRPIRLLNRPAEIVSNVHECWRAKALAPKTLRLRSGKLRASGPTWFAVFPLLLFGFLFGCFCCVDYSLLSCLCLGGYHRLRCPVIRCDRRHFLGRIAQLRQKAVDHCLCAGNQVS